MFINRYLRIATIALLFGIPITLFVFYGMCGGMPGEYSLTYISESKLGLEAFLYRGDPLRIYTNVFYHLGYCISKLFGQTGSWIGYHLIYCALLTLKGLLVLLICKLLRLRIELSVLAAAISVLHAADLSMGYIGQLNQFGITIWVLLSMCSFLYFLEQQSYYRSVTPDFREHGGIFNALPYLWLLLAIISSYFALWSYEGTLFGLLLYPVFFVLFQGQTRNIGALAGAFLVSIPSFIYSKLWLNRIFSQDMKNAYQAHVIRSDFFDIKTIAHDFWIMTFRLFNVSDWANNNVWTNGKLSLTITSPYVFFSLMIAIGLMVFFSISLGVSIYRSMRTSEKEEYKKHRMHYLGLSLGLCTLLGAFLLPFLALKSGNPYWRTQILPGPFAAILGAIILEAIFIWLLRYVWIPLNLRCILLSTTVGALLTVGFISIATRYDHYNRQWELTRAPIARLLQTIPAVHPGTVIMLQNVPLTAASWTSNYWFDMLVRLCYPGTVVGGAYSFAPADLNSSETASILNWGGKIITFLDGRPMLVPHGSLYRIEGEKVHLFLEGSYPLIYSASIKDVVVLDWTDSGPFKIIHDANQIDLAQNPNVTSYQPDAKICASKASPIALRRFASLLPSLPDSSSKAILTQK